MTEDRPNGSPPAPMPTFAEFYRALNSVPGERRDPFPWQRRLAEQIATTEQWPAEVGVPTGLGKTACLDIAVWWLASQADRAAAERTAPIRIWWVVNRRLLVDSTAEHAERIARAFTDPDAANVVGQDREVVARVAQRLGSLSAAPGGSPLDVIRLRGGVASRTPTDPSRPAVLLCTLPMYGSRLLFRGYGSKQRLRVVDAAMAGTDSLVLLDEAHLAPHLKALLPALAECTPGAHAILGEARSSPRIVALTATGDASGGRRFNLDDDDLGDPEVRKRLDAVKPLELRVETGDSAGHLADATLDLLRGASEPVASVVFTNTPKTARATFARLRKRMPEAEVLLLTGLAREREAEHVRARILDRNDGMAASRAADLPRRNHLIVVATQTLEVGADIDAEYLVTEACGVRALTQRLGRLNRLGRFPHARAAYVHLPPPKPMRGRKATDPDAWPVYGTEPSSVLERLQEQEAVDGTLNLSPRCVSAILGFPQELTGRAPEVLPGILWEWTKTTTPPRGEAPVEPYFSGIAGPQYSVSLVWRVHVPEDGERLWPRATDREAVDVPINEARDVLGDEDLRRLAADGVTVETTSGADLRPDDQIVLRSDRGLLDEFGWNRAASGPVVDASLIARLPRQASEGAGHVTAVGDVSLVARGLPLEAKAIDRLCGVAVGGLIQTTLGIAEDDEDIDPAARTEAADRILSMVRVAPTPSGWHQAEWAAFTGTLTPEIVEARREVPRLRGSKPAPEPLNGDFDETSLGPEAVELDRHGQAVAARARAVSNRIGLSPSLTDAVEQAGRLHDIGKAERRFQRWLDPEGKRRALVAKSDAPRHRWEAMRVAAHWPRGGRHEDLSARLVRAWLQQNLDWGDPMQRNLLIHLVISHHGKGRPLVPPVKDGTLDTVSAVVAGTSVAAPADLGIVDWHQPARFRGLSDRFGPWGLALLEAIVIRSDHAVSAGANAALDAQP